MAAASILRTLDGSLFETWTHGPDEQSDERREPRLRLLYHLGLERIGALSWAQLGTGAWQTVGRQRPAFALPGATTCSLDDPTISRAQFRLRWLAEEQLFEIEPVASARRKLGVVMPAGGSIEVVEVTERVRIEPGTCIAVENRVLLGLELATPCTTDADRLGLVGDSEVMWQLRENIRAVAAFRRPALISGPTGAGKELVARAIHDHSARVDKPFVTVNCAALPEHLVESLLFGHQKGAFTGADTNRAGVFCAADGGTLFLDELGEMPLLVQPKLLRTIQDGLVTAVGQHQSVSVDVRLIAATNRDLEREVAAQRMRADLYHRLAAHIVQVPALAARRFDVPALFVHFLAALRQEHPELAWLWTGDTRWKKTIPMGFFVDLLRCEWPGNVREVQNIAERCARLNARSGRFRGPDLPPATPVAALVRGAAPVANCVAPPAATQPQPDECAQLRERLATASELLDLAHKTVAKLFDQAALAQIWTEVERAGASDGPGAAAAGDSGDCDDRGTESGTVRLHAALHARAAERLFALIENHDFKQRRVAAVLGVSPSTLIKLMQRFGLPRAADLSRETIEAALDGAAGDLTAAARALKVSPQGLKKRLTLLNLERRKPGIHDVRR